MTEPNNDRQHLTDHTKEFKSDIATGPMRIPFKTFPADRISDDKTVEDLIHNAVLAEHKKWADPNGPEFARFSQNDLDAAVLAERAKHEYQNHVLAKLWEIVKPSEDSDYDTNNFYDYAREGVEARRLLESGPESFVVSQEGMNAGRWVVHEPGGNRPNKIVYLATREEAERAAERFNRVIVAVRETCARSAAGVMSKEPSETWPQRIAAVIRSGQ